MNRAAILDFVLCDVPGISAMLIGLYSVGVNGLYGYMNLAGIHFHAASLFTMGLVFLLAAQGLRMLATPMRMAVACLVVALGVHVYDVLWGLVSMLYRISPLPLGGVLGIGIAVFIMWRLNRNPRFINYVFASFPILLIVCIVSLVALGQQGYFQAMTLYDAGLGPDPNMNVLWLISKVFGVSIPLGFLGDKRAK